MVPLTSDTGATSVDHDGESFAPLAGSDPAVFELPDHVAAHLLTFPGLGWREATAADLPDPAIDPAPREEDAGRLTVDEALAELELDDDGDDDDQVDDETEAPAPKPRKRAPRKTAAAPAAG